MKVLRQLLILLFSLTLPLNGYAALAAVSPLLLLPHAARPEYDFDVAWPGMLLPLQR